MAKKNLTIAGIATAALLLVGGAGYLVYDTQQKAEAQEQALAEMQQLVERDKEDMQKEYERFTREYDELKSTIRNDSLFAQIEQEQARVKQLQAQLRNVKATNAAEISRLKDELESVRAVLRSYIIQVDSLQRANSQLTAERDEARTQYTQATAQIGSLTNEKAALNEKVAIASQLDATGVSISAQKSNGKAAKKVKDIARFTISFTLSKNVTAQAGQRTLYLRLSKPGGDIVGRSGSFAYENRTLDASAAKAIEYNGEEQRLTLYVSVNEFLSTGTFQAHIFADGKMIGSGSITIDK
ncbi:MAG: hypothetical protein Q4A44_06115 [Bacteroidales bacterium]|nr:hypothetical protein [Bacteroidales bacterium]